METINNITQLFKYYTGLDNKQEKNKSDNNKDNYNKKPDAYKNINSSSIKTFK